MSLSLAVGVARQRDYWWTVVRRTWRGSVVSAIFAPLFMVVAMGVLLGQYVDSAAAQLDGAPSYLAYLVPGLAVTHALQRGVSDACWPVMGSLKWNKVYFSQSATELEARHIATAHLVFILGRVAASCVMFTAVLAPFGVFATWWGPVGAVVAQLLTGMACATVVMGVAVRAKTDQVFSVIIRVGVIPLTLFSGAFFPISSFGPFWEWVARITPVWHGVNLSRMLSLDRVDWVLAGLHVTLLLAITVAGWVWTVRGLERRLIT